MDYVSKTRFYRILSADGHLRAPINGPPHAGDVD